MENTSVKSFSSITKDLYSQAGGKGSTLALMYQRGFPVPQGLVVFPSAFNHHGTLKDENWQEILKLLETIRVKNKDIHFAIRSSALSEDSDKASFAGEFETVLNVKDNDSILKAIYTVSQSSNAERVKVYSEAKDVLESHKVAIVIQEMIPSKISGVLFTVDPVTGNFSEMSGNYIQGIGEELVSGEKDPYIFKITKPKGIYHGPEEFKSFAKKIYKYAIELEKLLKSPLDIEWAISSDKIYLLQARPITTLSSGNLDTYDINDTKACDDLWVNTNVGEAVPGVVTPYTWSLIRHLDNLTTFADGYYIWSGNICGRIYSNFGRRMSAYVAMGVKLESALKTSSSFFGSLPKGMKVPIYPYTKKDLFKNILPRILTFFKNTNNSKKISKETISKNIDNCMKIADKINKCSSKKELLQIWKEELNPYNEKLWWLHCYGGTKSIVGLNTKNKLLRFVSEQDANSLMSTLGGNSGLASMGPVIGISKVMKGEISKEEYSIKYGHRSPYEMELSIPVSVEKENWLETQIQSYNELDINIHEMIANQNIQFQEAFNRFKAKYPKKINWLKKVLKEASEAAVIREDARSEFTREFRLNRNFAEKVGNISGLGSDIYFLYYQELLELLEGKEHFLKFIPARKENFKLYQELPPLPSIIRGRFDPFSWAKQPNDGLDFYDVSMKHESINLSKDKLIGIAGSSGLVEGKARIIKTLEEGSYLKKGEILVTATTNIGWTPLFPKAAAIITDVGAPLSHAAIVAREFGIPAVVGCGNATTQIKTGDMILVDGGNGTVQILKE